MKLLLILKFFCLVNQALRCWTAHFALCPRFGT